MASAYRSQAAVNASLSSSSLKFWIRVSMSRVICRRIRFQTRSVSSFVLYLAIAHLHPLSRLYATDLELSGMAFAPGHSVIAPAV